MTASSTTRCTSSRSPAPSATPPPRNTSPAKKPKARPPRARCAASSATLHAAFYRLLAEAPADQQQAPNGEPSIEPEPATAVEPPEIPPPPAPRRAIDPTIPGPGAVPDRCCISSSARSQSVRAILRPAATSGELPPPGSHDQTGPTPPPGGPLLTPDRRFLRRSEPLQHRPTTKGTPDSRPTAHPGGRSITSRKSANRESPLT